MFNFSAVETGLNVLNLIEHSFCKEKKILLLKVKAKLVARMGLNPLFIEEEAREFIIFLRGDKDIELMGSEGGFLYEGLVFTDTDESKEIKKQLDTHCEKYFPKEINNDEVKNENI